MQRAEDPSEEKVIRETKLRQTDAHLCSFKTFFLTIISLQTIIYFLKFSVWHKLHLTRIKKKSSLNYEVLLYNMNFLKAYLL